MLKFRMWIMKSEAVTEWGEASESIRKHVQTGRDIQQQFASHQTCHLAYLLPFQFFEIRSAIFSADSFNTGT